MRKDEAAMALADAFITEYRKYDFRFPSIANIQKSKWWTHFERAAELRYLDDWNARIWVKCQFDKYEKILPFRLYGKMAIEAFEEYKFRYIEGGDDREKQMITAMLSTYNTIKLWCKKNDSDYAGYFSEPRNRIKINRGDLSYHFLSICRPYWESPKIIKEYSRDKLKIKHAIVHSNKKLVKRLKEVMGDDFI